MPYPPLPASPTLTNPDMILPDYADYADYDRASSPERPESPLTHWKNVHAADLQQFSLATSQAMLGQGFVTGPMTPTTPIIYGNGTMLSDIGEVTEVETTPVKKPAPRQTMTTTATTPTQRASTTSASTTAPSANAHAASAASAALAAVVGSGGPSAAAGSGISSGPESAAAAIKKGGRSLAHSSDDAALRSSPTMGTAGAVYEPIKKRAAAARKAAAAAAHERRSSIDSNSTITTQDQQVLFADFDDTISVDDSVFQGDDEESVADSYVDASEPAGRPVADQHDGTLGQSSSLTPKGGSGDEDRTRYSTVSLSRRAEKILANAKRRLTV